MKKYTPVHILLAVSAFLFAIAADTAWAQQQPWSETGTVEQASANQLYMKLANNQIWVVHLDPKTKVEVDGAAEAAFLHTGLNVKLSGEIDKKGVLQSEIKQLEIFTPQDKRDLGLFAAGDAKPVRNAPPGSYEIKGRVGSFKEGLLTVTAGGKRITGKVAPDAEIKVHAASLTFAQQGDGVRVTGWQLPRPQQAGATEVAVTLAKPLSAPVKKGRAAKPARTPRATASPVQDPFSKEAGEQK